MLRMQAPHSLHMFSTTKSCTCANFYEYVRWYMLKLAVVVIAVQISQLSDPTSLR